MTRYQKILIILVLLLVVTNVVLLAFIWTGMSASEQARRPRPDIPEVRGKMLQNKLNFSEEQTHTFRKALKTHHRKMVTHRRELRKLKNEINQAIILSDSLALTQNNVELARIQTKIEQESQAFTAFLSRLCDDQQRQKLLDIYQHAMNRGQRKMNQD